LDKSIGQIAFEKWAELIPVAPGLAWETLPPTGQEGWEAIAEAVVEHYEDPEGLGPIARDMEPEELARFRNAPPE